MEKIYGLLIILFILSQVSERVANFLKLKLSDSRLVLQGTKLGFLLKPFTFNNTKVRTFDAAREKEREYRILKINLFIGFLIALSFRADLFCLFRYISNDPVSHLGWIKYKEDTAEVREFLGERDLTGILVALYTLAGCLLTGIFLSFGSKFWHDLIDLVLQIKNYKSMLTTEGIQKIEKQFSGLETTQQDSLIDNAIEENYDNWKAQYPNIVGCSSGLKVTDGSPQPQKAIIFKVSDKKTAVQLAGSKSIPPEISYKGLSIPTDVIQINQPRTMQIQHPGDNYAISLIGTNVSLDQQAKDFGSVGLKVKRGNDEFMLSCCHVYYPIAIGNLNPVLADNQFQTPLHQLQTMVTIPSKEYRSLQGKSPSPVLTGFAVEGRLSRYVDAALSVITQGSLDNSSFFYNGLGQRKVTAELPDDQIKKGLEVEIFGCVSGRITGKVKEIAKRTEVRIVGPGYAFTYQFNDLIVVEAGCQPGDSGAPVLTPKGEVVGILSAGDTELSYVVPFQSIKNNLTITL
ncbi:trypsin-like peptidase domain-containing protein [Pedobacter sp. HDW13]|uniref:trypsin-like peptidase domain-containing protein n=1 Tax=Pedobacter sp. HDW13 TaxID=2714940 RepID=UPI00140A4DEE|nr:trypsin-like peptidase domain-containing protein [Pedobacter sp. HDW13]QIL42371.1 trypsin-like peptidase domain-containing protein [Pedobacter sp. HDW13]